MTTKFSLITSTYNRLASGYLDQCMRSVQEQEEGPFDFEHIIVDDGSTDRTRDFVERKASEDPRIRYIYEENAGPARAVQDGIRHSSGTHVVVMDDDDLLSGNSLLLRANYASEHPDVDWFYGKAVWIDENGDEIPSLFESRFFEDFLYERTLIGNTVHNGTPTIKRAVFDQIEWPDWLNRSQDYFLWLELLRPERGLTVGFLDEVLYLYRWHGNMHTQEHFDGTRTSDEKTELNARIKGLHPRNLVFLAEEIRKIRQEDGDTFREQDRLLWEQQAIIGEQAQIIEEQREIIEKLDKSPIFKLFKKLYKTRRF